MSSNIMKKKEINVRELFFYSICFCKYHSSIYIYTHKKQKNKDIKGEYKESLIFNRLQT